MLYRAGITIDDQDWILKFAATLPKQCANKDVLGVEDVAIRKYHFKTMLHKDRVNWKNIFASKLNEANAKISEIFFFRVRVDFPIFWTTRWSSFVEEGKIDRVETANLLRDFLRDETCIDKLPNYQEILRKKTSFF